MHQSFPTPQIRAVEVQNQSRFHVYVASCAAVPTADNRWHHCSVREI